MPACTSYILCTTSRSGSTLLCRLLQATGRAGHPDSWFHRPSVAAWAAGVDLTSAKAGSEQDELRALLREILKAGRGATEMFGLRLMRKSFAYLVGQLTTAYPGDLSEAELFDAAFTAPRYIHLVRQDTLAQAISFVRAEQTGLWHIAPDGREVERLAKPAPPEYDRPRIAEVLRKLDADKAAWEVWFKAQKITPHRIMYEDLDQNPAGVMEGVLEFLGLESGLAHGLQPGVARMSDSLSAGWADRFREETT